MKTKGAKIYIITSLILLLCLVFPNSTALFSLEFSQLKDYGAWSSLIPDLGSILILILGYVVLKLFYTKRSSYVKWYPGFALLVILLWTAVVQFKWR